MAADNRQPAIFGASRHVDDAADAVAAVHVVEAVVDLRQRAVVRHVLVDLQLALEVLCGPGGSAPRAKAYGGGTGLTLDQARDLRAALDAAERRPPPGAAGDQLEPVRDRRRQLLG